MALFIGTLYHGNSEGTKLDGLLRKQNKTKQMSSNKNPQQKKIEIKLYVFLFFLSFVFFAVNLRIQNTQGAIFFCLGNLAWGQMPVMLSFSFLFHSCLLMPFLFLAFPFPFPPFFLFFPFFQALLHFCWRERIVFERKSSGSLSYLGLLCCENTLYAPYSLLPSVFPHSKPNPPPPKPPKTPTHHQQVIFPLSSSPRAFFQL